MPRPLLVLAAVFLLPTAATAGPGEELFEKHVRPVLVEKCVSCHGAEKAKGGLRLDTRAGLLAGGDGGPVAVPGKPAPTGNVTGGRKLGTVLGTVRSSSTSIANVCRRADRDGRRDFFSQRCNQDSTMR